MFPVGGTEWFVYIKDTIAYWTVTYLNPLCYHWKHRYKHNKYHTESDFNWIEFD